MGRGKLWVYRWLKHKIKQDKMKLTWFSSLIQNKKQMHETGLHFLLRKKNQPDPLKASENTPKSLRSPLTPWTWIWLIFQFKEKMQSVWVKPATKQNKSTQRSVCLLIFLIATTPDEFWFNKLFKLSERKSTIDWCRGEITAMSAEGTKDETTIGGRNFHGDVWDVQIKIIRVSWWDWWQSWGIKIE